MVVLALPLAVPAALLIGANTGAGRDLVASAVGELSGGRVRIDGLVGILPHRPRAALLELRDEEGTWLRAEDAALHVEPLALLRGEIVVDSLTARSLELIRRPARPESASEPALPAWPVRLARLNVHRLAIDGVLPGAPALELDGAATLGGDGRVQARLAACVIGGSAWYRLDFSGDGAEQRFELAGLEAPEGLLGALAAQRGWHLPAALGDAIRLVTTGRRTGDTWHLDSARIETEAATLQAQGTVAPDAVALGWTLDLPDLGALLPGALGPVLVRGDIAGPLAAPGVVATLVAEGLVLPAGVRVAAVAGDVRASDLLGAIELDASARLTGLAAGEVAGDLALTARGPAAATRLSAVADLRAGGGPVRVDLDARLDALGRDLALERFEARARGEVLRLVAPARLDLSEGVAVDRLALGLRKGTIEVSGRLAPALALDATVVGLPADLLRLAVPGPGLSGTFGGQARLTGPVGAVGGEVRVRGDGLRLTDGPGRALPPASVDLTAQVGASGAMIEAKGAVGKGAAVGLRGRVGSALDLRADGHLDLALLDPLLAGSGRRARGKAQLDARIAGTMAEPRLDGSLRIAEGGLWDQSIGLALLDLNGRLGLAGDTLRVEQLTASAGPGTVALEGTVGLLAPGMPVDLHLRARDARPLQRDELDTQGNADVRLTGAAAGRLMLAGDVRLDHVEVRLPERLPPAVATLAVRETGQRRAEPPLARGGSPQPLDLELDLALSAPRRVEVRGRGVEAELGGEVQIRGPLTAPRATGSFDLIRGQYSLVGQPLRFSRGRIGFDGGALLNPTLELEVRTTAAGGTAILAVSGTVATPRVELRGEPEMPQDEVLSRLLFGIAGGRLSPWQATRLGLAAASLAGKQAGAPGALARIGRGLGLGRLGLMADEQGDATLEGGRDIGDRAYLGARQSSRTGEPQGVLRFEASPRVRLEADVGPVGGTRAGVAFEHEF